MERFVIKHFSQLVYDFCGLNFQNNLTTLESKIVKRLQTLNLTLWEYIKYLERNPTEWDQVVEILTINETYFYREDHQLNELIQNVLVEWKDRKTKPIKIWSAACSTGEEPYTLAMLIQETGLFAEGQIEIMATDINKKVLQLASQGTYSKRSLSFRRIPDYLLTKYFVETSDSFEVNQSTKRMVHFRHLNLLDPLNMSKMMDFDIIFCRNVLIYFDQPTIFKVVSSFYQSLKNPGYLFLGHAENISTMKTGLQTVNRQNTFYYRKG